jgi:hypothetical protein
VLASRPASTATDATASKGRSRGEALAPHLCLWALQCQLSHPVDGRAMNIEIPRPEVFAEVLQLHGVSSVQDMSDGP